MKKKKRIKNRGIFLAVISIALLVVYIIYDHTAFAREVPTLTGQLKSYLSDLSQLTVNKEKIAKDNWDPAHKEITALLEKYWTTTTINSSSHNYLSNRNMLSANAEELLNPENVMDEIYEGHSMKSLSFDGVTISVSKSGPNMAYATLYANLTAVSDGPCYFFNVTEVSSTSYKNLAEKETVNTLTYSSDLEMNLMMVKENGSWKISGGYSRFYGENSDVTYQEKE